MQKQLAISNSFSDIENINVWEKLQDFIINLQKIHDQDLLKASIGFLKIFFAELYLLDEKKVISRSLLNKRGFDDILSLNNKLLNKLNELS
jgi:hypothetical protein